MEANHITFDTAPEMAECNRPYLPLQHPFQPASSADACEGKPEFVPLCGVFVVANQTDRQQHALSLDDAVLTRTLVCGQRRAWFRARCSLGCGRFWNTSPTHRLLLPPRGALGPAAADTGRRADVPVMDSPPRSSATLLADGGRWITGALGRDGGPDFECRFKYSRFGVGVGDGSCVQSHIVQRPRTTSGPSPCDNKRAPHTWSFRPTFDTMWAYCRDGGRDVVTAAAARASSSLRRRVAPWAAPVKTPQPVGRSASEQSNGWHRAGGHGSPTWAFRMAVTFSFR